MASPYSIPTGVLRHLRAPTVVLAAGLLLAACDGGSDGAEDGNGAGSDGGGDLTVEATEFEFDPAQTDAQPGEITITMDNVGDQPHTWTIEGMEDAILIDAEPGESDTGTVELDSGDYAYYCDVPGHRESGMEGTLTIE